MRSRRVPSVSVSLAIFLFFSQSFSLTPYLSKSFSLSFSITLAIFPLSLSLSLAIFLPFALSLSLAISLPLSRSVFLSHAFSRFLSLLQHFSLSQECCTADFECNTQLKSCVTGSECLDTFFSRYVIMCCNVLQCRGAK